MGRHDIQLMIRGRVRTTVARSVTFSPYKTSRCGRMMLKDSGCLSTAASVAMPGHVGKTVAATSRLDFELRDLELSLEQALNVTRLGWLGHVNTCLQIKVLWVRCFPKQAGGQFEIVSQTYRKLIKTLGDGPFRAGRGELTDCPYKVTLSDSWEY